jgi:curved DNA-binding protein CbpA
MAEPFEVLGISPTASLDDARAAFKRLAQIYHPDRYATSSEHVREEAERKMRDLNVAFSELVARRRGVADPQEILANEKWLAEWWEAWERRRREEETRGARFRRWDEIEQARRAREQSERESISMVWRAAFGAPAAEESEQPPSPSALPPAPAPKPSSLAARLNDAKKRTNINIDDGKQVKKPQPPKTTQRKRAAKQAAQ